MTLEDLADLPQSESPQSEPQQPGSLSGADAEPEPEPRRVELISYGERAAYAAKPAERSHPAPPVPPSAGPPSPADRSQSVEPAPTAERSSFRDPPQSTESASSAAPVRAEKPAFGEKRGIFDKKLSDRPERFDDFTVWQEARRLTNRVYDITDKPSLAADPNLREELRKAAVAAMTFLAEGVEGNGDREFVRGLTQAKSAAGAVRSLVFVGVDRGYFEEQESTELQGRSTALGRMIGSQLARLKRAETTDFKKKAGKPEYGEKKFPPRSGGYGKPPGKPYGAKPPYPRHEG